MATMPGVKKPVNSWMYWKAWSKPPSRGLATIIAISMAENATTRPIVTRCFCEVSSGLKCRYMSIVKMVEMLLVIEASDETIAAISAANTRPLRPIGSRVMAIG